MCGGGHRHIGGRKGLFSPICSPNRSACSHVFPSVPSLVHARVRYMPLAAAPVTDLVCARESGWHRNTRAARPRARSAAKRGRPVPPISFSCEVITAAARRLRAIARRCPACRLPVARAPPPQCRVARPAARQPTPLLGRRIAPPTLVPSLLHHSQRRMSHDSNGSRQCKCILQVQVQVHVSSVGSAGA